MRNTSKSIRIEKRKYEEENFTIPLEKGTILQNISFMNNHTNFYMTSLT